MVGARKSVFAHAADLALKCAVIGATMYFAITIGHAFLPRGPIGQIILQHLSGGR